MNLPYENQCYNSNSIHVMKRKIFIITISTIIAFLLLIFLLKILFIEPWVEIKIGLAANPKNS